MKKEKIGLLLGIMCMLLSIGIAIQIKTVKSSSTGVGKTQSENELRDSVLRWKEKYEEVYAKQAKKEKELEKLRNQVVNQDEDSVKLSEELQENNMLLGLYDVSGEGIIITLKDATKSAIKTALFVDPNDFVVHDADLMEVVNALKESGAEAISINGQRIVDSTAITCLGNVIQINGEKVGVPFEIKAIGLTERLYGGLTMPYGYLDNMESAGIQVKVEKSDNIVIPKYERVNQFEYAENVE